MTKTDPSSLTLAEAPIRRLAEVLAYAFRIDTGAGLVWILGTGAEEDNREAIATWIRVELTALDAELAGALLPLLLKRLEHTLAEWETRAC